VLLSERQTVNFFAQKYLLAELYQYQQRGPLIMNHRV